MDIINDARGFFEIGHELWWYAKGLLGWVAFAAVGLSTVWLLVKTGEALHAAVTRGR